MADISGIIVSSVTPFTQSHELDNSWVPEYLSHLSDGGVQGVSILDTVSEGATLSFDEMQQLVDAAFENIGGLQFIVGNGASDLTDSISILSYGLGKGADAVLLRPPSNESNSIQSIQFFSAVLDELPNDASVILGGGFEPEAQDLSDETIDSLLGQNGDKIMGIQARSRDSEIIKRLIETYSTIGVYTALDAMMIQGLGLGVSGVFSVFGNVVPSAIMGIVESHNRGEDQEDKMWLLDQLEGIFHEHGTIGALKGLMPLLAEPNMTYPRNPYTIPSLGDLKKLEDRMIEVFGLPGLFHSFS